MDCIIHWWYTTSNIYSNIVSSFVPSAITQPFFELQIPDFAWKFVWIVQINYKSTKSTKVQKYISTKVQKYKNINLKFGHRYCFLFSTKITNCIQILFKIQYILINWPLRDRTRSASAIQFPPPPPTMVPNRRGLVKFDTRSVLLFEQQLN